MRGVLIWAIVIAAFSAFAGIIIVTFMFPPLHTYLIMRVVMFCLASGSASLILMLIERVPE